MFPWSTIDLWKWKAKKKLIFLLSMPLQNIIMCESVMGSIGIRSVLDSWLKHLEDFYLFHISLYKFVLLSLLWYIKRMFQEHREQTNYIIHTCVTKSFLYVHGTSKQLFLLFVRKKGEEMKWHEKIIAFVFGKIHIGIHWHTFCWFFFVSEKYLYSNVINHANLFRKMYNFMCFFVSANKFATKNGRHTVDEWDFRFTRSSTTPQSSERVYFYLICFWFSYGRKGKW